MNWCNAEKDTPLHAAARRGHIETVNFLLEKGANTSLLGGDGLTALHIACRRGDPDCVAVLVDQGADVGVKSSDGKTALEIAREKGYGEICTRLEAPPRAPIPVSQRGGGRISTAMKLSSKISHEVGESTPMLFRRTEESSADELPSIYSAQSIPGQSSRIHGEAKSTKMTQKPSLPPSLEYNMYKDFPSQQNDMKEASLAMQTVLALEQVLLSISVLYLLFEIPLSLFHLYLPSCKFKWTQQRERRDAESKAEMMRNQAEVMRDLVQELKQELSSLKIRLDDTENENEALKDEMALLSGKNLSVLSLEQCESLEVKLRSSLVAVETRKEEIKRGETGELERRLCVICHEKEKSIVLLPCRHMCLCADCADHDSLVDCPLCRRSIAHKFSVFA